MAVAEKSCRPRCHKKLVNAAQPEMMSLKQILDCLERRRGHQSTATATHRDYLEVLHEARTQMAEERLIYAYSTIRHPRDKKVSKNSSIPYKKMSSADTGSSHADETLPVPRSDLEDKRNWIRARREEEGYYGDSFQKEGLSVSDEQIEEHSREIEMEMEEGFVHGQVDKMVEKQHSSQFLD
eukprot:TRINITY_DN11151_c0_g1_i1.p2 TRINITY_DN11151_c0_g1~~TRINITY_DN11151_c0_g1_i1.p2  ORF type:complete len:182 (+),score=36.40 TRINITY_DN11151_c0_g1_i1:173-718(+)